MCGIDINFILYLLFVYYLAFEARHNFPLSFHFAGVIAMSFHRRNGWSPKFTFGNSCNNMEFVGEKTWNNSLK